MSSDPPPPPELPPQDAPSASAAPGPTPEPGTPGRPPWYRRRAVRLAALGTALLVAGCTAAGWAAYQRLERNIRTDDATARALDRHAGDRPGQLVAGAQNILVMGTDREPGADSERSDTVLLLHISADRRRAAVVGVPRDLMVSVPSCEQPGGGLSRAQYAQFNWAFQFGGPACTIRAFEQLTGVRVDHHLLVDFDGFRKVVDALGGVEVDLPVSEYHEEEQIYLPAGRQVLRGDAALAYFRARHGVGDGSDTARMARDRDFLQALSDQVRSRGVLSDPFRLYPLLDTVSATLTADSGLASVPRLYSLADALRSVPDGATAFLTVPRKPYPQDPDRDVPAEPAASRLFSELREDRPVTAG
ncbi:LCP family protein [Kitasatospora arboriphila]|uniref:LCP family protein n=2 Tax=Kitasatospora arboriphila TaxID=258052 RepID=A0ABN1TYD9_9ACTN